MTREDTLCFHKLEGYQEFLRNCENVNQRGVYVWGFVFYDEKTAQKNDFIPYYVGKHRKNIYKRIQEHIRDIRYGTHRILSPNNLLKHNKAASYTYKNVNADDYVYINEGRSKSDLEPHVQVSLMPHINFYIDNLYITYISVNHLDLGSDENTYIDYLERYVQDMISRSNGTISRGGKKYPDTFRPVISPGEGADFLLTRIST